MADRYKVITFQLPLSGSQSRQSAMRQAPLLLSTPSLGITHLFVASTRVGKTTFNSLSRDHGAVVVVVVVGAVEVFQLPLSGSPSPIPGFFGSPRLSAAAPFRTNDF